MNREFPTLLRCPSCGGDFGTKSFVEDDRGIEEGVLQCGGCGRIVPVIAGVPRMLPPYLNSALLSTHGDFFRRHAFSIPQAPPATPFDRLNQAIFDAFTYNWGALPITLRQVAGTKSEAERDRSKDPLHPEDRRVFRDNVAPLDTAFFRGKIGLDAGCNVGRHLYAAHEMGARMVGLEQTFAVDRARVTTRNLPQVDLIQGSIFEFPFRPEVFDFAMCFGVLHHTPDAAEAFRAIAKSIKPGGSFLTMVYGIDEMALWYRISHMRGLRKITTRIPLSATRRVCEALAVGMKYGILTPLAALAPLPGVGSIARRFPFFYLRREPVIAISRNFFDRLAPPVTTFHSREEIEGWYRDAGFQDVRVTRREVNAWRACGIRNA